MAEPTQIVFSHKEVAEALIRQHGIHDGIWGLYIKFGIKGANVGLSDSDVLPAAIVPILQIGLQKFEKEHNISVDAARINPRQISGSVTARRTVGATNRRSSIK